MANASRVVKAAVLLGIAVLIVLVIVGVYAALDAAPSYTLGTSSQSTKDAQEGAPDVPTSSSASEKQGGADNAPKGSAAQDSGGARPQGPTAQQPALGLGSPAAPTQPSGPGSTPASPASPAAPTQPPASAPGDGSAPAQGPAPKPVWHEPVYKTVHHDAVYQTVHHDAEYTQTITYWVVCHQCGYKVQGSIYPHQDATGHSGFDSDVPFVEQVLARAAYDEQVLISPAYDEQVLVSEGYWE